MWIGRNGVFCSIVTGFGKRISLRGLNKYPSAEYWESPERACICYQASGGRGVFETVCYSNLYPAEYRGLVQEAIDNTLTKMELLSGQKYPRGFAEGSNMDIKAFAEELGAEVAITTQEQADAIRELMDIAKTKGASGLKRRKKEMKALLKKVLKQHEEAGAADMLKRQFNKKAAAADVQIKEAGRFDSFNAEGTNITAVYDYVKKSLEK